MSPSVFVSRSVPWLVSITLGAAAFGAPLPALADTPVFINEIHYDNVGTDAGEAIEIAGPAGTDLSRWSLVLYNGTGGASYDSRVVGQVIADQGDGFGTVLVNYPSNGIQNGAPDGIALLDASGELVQFVSYEGAFVGAGGAADGVMSMDIGVSQSSAAVGLSLQLAGSGMVYEDFTWFAPDVSTFGAVNVMQSFGEGPPPPPPTPCVAPSVAVGSVQGSGALSPLVGQQHTVRGVVVGDYEGPSPALRGFYLQDEGDSDLATSDGIFVFNGDNDSVQLGDVVQVTGWVSEYFEQTQLSVSSLEFCEESAMIVEPTAVYMPFTSFDELERVEGMLVSFPQSLVVTEHFQLGRFGQVVVSAGGRLVQPTHIAAPGPDAAEILAANNLNRLIIDDAVNRQNPDPIVFGRGGAPLSADNTLRGGDSIAGATGVMTYTWAGNAASGNAYRLRPVGALDGFHDFLPTSPRPTEPPDVGGALRVASFNVLNYFVTLDDHGPVCGPNQDVDCRGAESALEFERQRAKLLSALSKLDADVLGLVEIENTPGANAEGDLVAGLDELLGAGSYAAVDAGPTVGTDAIKVALLYKPSAVVPVGAPAVLDFDLDPLGLPRTRAALAQTFRDNTSGGVFSVVVNHFKSKGSSELAEAGGPCELDPLYADCDRGDGQGYFNATRTASAEKLVAWLGSAPTSVFDSDWLILGDLNAYAQEDPISVLKAAGYVDLHAHFHGSEAHSYAFDGQWGYLDYALASPGMLPQVSSAAAYAINADEPAVLDYNANFKSAAQIANLYAPDEFRTADHDPVVLGLDLISSACDLADPAAYHVVLGSAGDDVLNGTNGPDLIVAGAGNDTLFGSGGDDLLCGGEGSDLINGAAGDDIIDGGPGDDLLLAGGGADEVFGGAGTDVIECGAGQDLAYGEAGADLVLGGAGADTLDGGDDTDIVVGGGGTDFCAAEWRLLCEF